ncbi:Rha family transcriptional regulator [uncultured Eubacterium sp.]|uniref:Rha family transcriptional regulator n=1 Tax=uncultured Eubacterium sp. TaxID=165185 RepID=UPI0032654F81
MEQLEQTLTSMEVAEMVEKTHANMLRDIKRYCKQMEQNNVTGKIKIDVADFFRKNTYKDEQGKERLCYDITKKGCEFIAHKLTGVKGTAFTAQYINRFHDMERYITEQKQPQPYVGSYPSLVNKWMHEQEPNFKTICKAYGISRRELYHKILLDIGDDYNVDNYRVYYKRDTGHGAEYIMDVVAFYPELKEAAETAIGIHLRRIRMYPQRNLKHTYN